MPERVGLPATQSTRQFLRRLPGVLGHPLVLLLIGGAISALVVPTLTQRWQDHQRQLDIQEALVSDVTASSTSFVIALEFAYLAPRAESGGAKALNAAYRQWQIKSAVTEARLRAYYPSGPIVREFMDYSSALLLVWSAHANRQPDAGLSDVARVLHEQPPSGHESDPTLAFIAVESRLFSARDALVKRILSTLPRV